MADVDRTRAYLGPRDPLESRKENTPLDPEKFKKVLRIEESDETQKRDKRRLKRSEEVEEEEKQKPSTDSPAEATVQFNEYMKDESQGINPFAEQAKTPMKRGEREGFNIKAETEGKTPSPALGAGVEGGSVGQEEEERFTAGLPQAPPPEEPPPYYPQAQEEPAAPAVQEFFETPSQPPQTSQSKEEKEKQREEEVKKKHELLPEEMPAKKEMTFPKKISADEEMLKAEMETTKGKKMPTPQQVEKKIPENVSQEEKDKFFEQYAPKGKQSKVSEEKQKLLELEASAPKSPAEALLEKQQAMEFGKEKKKDKEGEQGPNIQLEGAVGTQPSLDIPLPPTQAATPAYTNLSPQMFEFFEKMVGLITIAQHQGVTQTKVTLNMSNSVFNGAQIILDHYSTAPGAFNVTLAGSPEAMAYFNANVDDLIAAMQQTKFSFEVNVQRPILLAEYQAIQKKSAAEKAKEDRKEKKQRVQKKEDV